ncbi:TetR family transcriptional regulator [Mycobacterium antarcticum]|uniref:TetR/AcrR family transcriptional regulator n=1 Tax=unclassified Mycolicibacterium TaxID=2636767 RepID=UPI002390D035|nr:MULTISPECIES: TetR/AcrR family transcriptional regulator [unclassified Mycolicibacterium]BDX32327.1 TetR family transcriptional regulator [Mycolicibacterium sp. TUM20985]GLP84127.1 TetR family transcriptional regulator [Mycolicibacterium sp. TUM20984]
MDTRDRLLNATIALLTREGLGRITTRAIVAEAGTHLPSVNYYYGSKDALVRAALAETLRRWGQTTMSVIDTAPESSLNERVDHSVRRFVATLANDRGYVVAAVEGFAAAERDEDIRRALAAAYGEFRDVVASHGPPRPAGSPQTSGRDSRVFASLMIALFDGLAIQWLLDPATAPTAEEILAALDLLATSRTATGTRR